MVCVDESITSSIVGVVEMLAASMLCLALAAAGQSDQKWAVVTSREGNFTVEMPAKPTRTRASTVQGAGGRMKIEEILCETARGAFIVTRIESPVVIAKGSEEAFLDFARDYFADQFKGKVTSDRKVRLDLNAGRDFVVRVQVPGEGPVELRVREYLHGRTIYALIAGSEPGKSLPPETARFLGSFAFGIHPEGTTIKADARETEAVGRDLPGWGTAIDPDEDVTFNPSQKSLVLEIPGTLHDLVADIGKFNAPRVLRPVEGDFVATVRIDGSFNPKGKSTKEKTYPLNAGGLLMWKDAENYVSIQRTAMLGKGDQIKPLILFEEREGGHRGATHNQIPPNGPLYLRLERQKGRITGAISENGKNWKVLKPMDTAWARGPMQVGLMGVNTASEPCKLRYMDYSLKAD